MIAYMLQVHNRFAQAASLIEWIYHPDNIYFVVVDSAVQIPEEFVGRTRIYKNVLLFNDLPGTWGGASLVAATLETMRRALEVSETWRSFINLSGVDIPLKSQSEILAALAERRANGETSFIADFGSREFTPHGFVDETIHLKRVINFRPDLAIEIFGRARDLFIDGGSPITRPAQRIQIHVTEDIAAKRLSIRPLYHIEAMNRERLFSISRYHFGRQWFVLDRRACEFAVSSPLSLLLFEHLKSVLIPDECFFQTLFRSKENDTKGIVFNRNYRFHFGEPHHLRDDHLRDMQSSGAFFARKLFPEGEQNEQVLEFVKSKMHR